MPPQRRGHRDPAPPWGAHTSSGVGHSWKWIATSAARHRATVAPTSSTSAARASSDTTSTCFSKAPTLHVIHSTSTIGPSSGAAGCGPGRGEAALSGKARRGPISVPVRPRMQVSGGGGYCGPKPAPADPRAGSPPRMPGQSPTPGDTRGMDSCCPAFWRFLRNPVDCLPTGAPQPWQQEWPRRSEQQGVPTRIRAIGGAEY